MTLPTHVPTSNRVRGSLAQRVLLICLSFLVIPLLFHSILTYRAEKAFQVKELFNQLQIIGQDHLLFLEEILKQREIDLDLLASLLQEPTTEHQALIENSKKIQKWESLFFFPEEIEWPPFFAKQREELETKKSILFLQLDPAARTTHLYIGKSFPQFALFGEIPLAPLEQAPLPFHFTLLSEKGVLFMSDKAEPIPPSFHIYSLEDIKTPRRLPQALPTKEQNEHFGIQFPVNNAPFSLIAYIPVDALITTHSYWASNVTALFFLLIILGGGVCFWLTWRMAKPLQSLIDVMQRVRTGDLKAQYERDLFAFEINYVGEDFNKTILSIEELIQEAKNQKIARELLSTEFKIGHQIQRSILPKEMPNIPKLDIASGFIAAQEVAGDFYDLFLKEDSNELVIAIADAAGKGISACLYSLCVRSFLRSFASDQSSLTDIVAKTNKLFCLDTAESGSFVTLWTGVLNIDTLQLIFTSCGHPPGLLKHSNGKIVELTTQGIALGVNSNMSVQSRSSQLFSGDFLILYTDGIIETHNQKMELFGKERLIKLISSSTASSAKDLLKEILLDVEQFKGSILQQDDLTLLIIKIT